MNKQELADSLLKKHLGEDYSWLKGNGPLSKVTAAIVEAMGVQQAISPKLYKFLKGELIAHADRLLRDRGASSKDTFECLELAFDDLQNQFTAPAKAVESMDSLPAIKGMKWVKASETNPTKSGYYFTHGSHIKSYPLTYWDDDKSEWGDEIIEWLESASSSNEDYVPSNSNTDDTSLASHSCTDGNSIEQNKDNIK